MSAIVVYLLITILLFVSVFITKRRFGLLGLALAAGSILGGIWGYDAGLVLGVFGISSGMLASALASSLIVVLPAFVLLFHGDKYKTLIGRVIGASLFTLLAVAFLIEPLSHGIIPQGIGSEAFRWLFNNSNTVIGWGLVVAIVDLFLSKTPHLPKKHRKH